MGAEEIDLEEDARRYAIRVYLLDTCTLLWATNKPEYLSGPARAILREPNGMIAVSVINYWEIANKAEKHGIADIGNWWEHRVMPLSIWRQFKCAKSMSPKCCVFRNVIKIHSTGC